MQRHTLRTSPMRTLRWLALALAILAPVITMIPNARAQSWTPHQAVERLGEGVNFGNALESPNFEGEWGMIIEDEYFELVADAGFDSIRLPIRWNAYASTTPPYTIDQAIFDRVDHLVDQALANGLAIIVDLHHYDELHIDPAGHTTRFVALWEQIAAHYADQPKEVVFELLNEPHENLTTAVWGTIIPQALDVIRPTNPDRMVIIGGGFWNTASELQNLVVPDDDFLIGTFHMYEPFQFTHQGAEWVSGSDAWLGTTWDSANPADTVAPLAAMDAAATWSASTGIPILMGEFGAYSTADLDSRVKWTTWIVDQAEVRGFAWSYWEFGAGFGIYDRTAGAWRTALLNALDPDPGTPGATTTSTSSTTTTTATGPTTTTTTVPPPDSDVFVDIDDSEFFHEIEWLAEQGITKGCNPPTNDQFCPTDAVTRAEMAAFLVRALALPNAADAGFTDISGLVFAADINALAAAGVTKGCNPPLNDRYCPSTTVTRGQMAAFLVRGYDLHPWSVNPFVDTTTSVYINDINALAYSGVTKGCDPPANDRYCPSTPVTREQMAAFLYRVAYLG